MTSVAPLASLMGSTGTASLPVLSLVSANSFHLLPHTPYHAPPLVHQRGCSAAPFDFFCWDFGIMSCFLLHNKSRYLILVICWEVLGEAFMPWS